MTTTHLPQRLTAPHDHPQVGSWVAVAVTLVVGVAFHPALGAALGAILLVTVARRGSIVARWVLYGLIVVLALLFFLNLGGSGTSQLRTVPQAPTASTK